MEIETDAFNREVAAAIELSLGPPLTGDPADRPDLHGDLPGLPAALGRGLATIHRSVVPPGLQPADLGELIRTRLDRGAVTPADMPDPYSRYDPEQLIEIWSQGEERGAGSGAPVCLVGGLTIDRLLIHSGEVAGVRGAFGLIGDRHLDLAVIQTSIHHTLGAEAVFGFYEAYGSDPNIVLLDQHVLSGMLLGWIR
ncbi:MAG: hypothetical protein KJN63_06700 [Acidimicrobiia bacterium]|nr:hypothetical protein [Acidimicrobiia bacterium]